VRVKARLDTYADRKTRSFASLTFATRLPTLAAPSRSSVVHHHLTNFLTSPVVFEPGSTVENEKDQTRRLRRNVTLAIEGGHVYRTLVAVEVEKKGKGLCVTFADC
jgi:hypothetical protein